MAQSKGQWTEAQINGEVRRLRAEYADHMARLRVRRLLIDMVHEAAYSSSTGTHVPAPFDKSALIIKSLIGEVQQGVLHYTSRIAANAPQPVVSPAVGVSQEITQRVDRHAADQERLMAAMWAGSGGRQVQWQVGWSQAWGRGGYILTLPREAQWGLPERRFYDETDSELERLQREGKAEYSPDESTGKYRETGSSWMERRRKAAQSKALNGTNLFTLEALAPDVVYPSRDSDGLKYAAIVTEAPASEFRAGTDLAKEAARYAGITGDDVGKWGIYRDKSGAIVGGVTQGGEMDVHPGSTWTLIRFVTRREIYYLVGSTNADTGTLIYSCEHLGDDIPLVWVPSILTDSARPGSESSSPMESVFAYAPIINQALTLLSNVASYNAIPRWVIVQPDGSLVRDPDTGDPMTITSETAPGLDPTDATVIAGTPQQLTIDADTLVKLLAFYAERLDSVMPAPAAQGSAGASGAAWTIRQLIQQSQESLRQPVDNSAHAWKQVWRRWVHWMKGLDVPIYCFSAPGKHTEGRAGRHLIEFDPANLVEAFDVRQDSNTASDRIVLQQAGIEMMQAGVITMRQYLEEYALEDDPREAEIDLDAYAVAELVMKGASGAIQPGSLLYDVAEVVRARLAPELMRLSPNAAIAQAELMAQRAQMTAQAQLMPPQQQGGNPAEAAGIRQPGMGMGVQQPGSPEQALPAPGPGPVAVA